MLENSPQLQSKKAALGYLRISDKKQIKGESKHNQKEAIQKYADANGIKIIKWFFDEAKSGKNTERDELQNLLKMALKMKGTIDYVLVYKMNRASRDIDSYVIGIKSVLASKGIKVRSATEQFDDTPMGNFMESLYVMVGQLDNENKRETVNDNMARQAKQGYWLHKPIRGYKAAKIHNVEGNDRATMQKGAEADKVTKILLRFNRGDIILAELCRYAAREGLLGLNGKQLSQEVITKMIKRPEYAGFVHDKFTNYELVPGKHPALISEEVYWQNQEILKRKNNKYLIGLKHHTINVMAPLSRFILCSNCHKHMTRERPGGKYRYTCKRPDCKGLGSVLVDDVHTKFEKMLVNVTPKPNTLKLMKEILVRTSLKELGNINQDLAELRDTLDEMAITRSNTIKKYVNGQLSDEDKQMMIDQLDSEKLDVSHDINALEQQQSISEANIEYALNFMANIAKQWSDASLELKQKFQSLIFPEGFEYDIKSDNFIINKISPLYSVITNEMGANNGNNSLMVIPRRVELLLPG
jgi:site-specific DNA recombinase